ncbi:MAG: CBS domain-containing protein [Thermodesulfobacteriota bacterium]
MGEIQANNDQAWFLCDVLGQKVEEPGGRVLGRLFDLVVDVREQDPPVTGLVLSTSRHGRFFLPWSWVQELKPRPGLVKVKSGAGQALTEAPSGEGEVWLRKSLLDKQIVDTGGAKVVRVNDLQLRRRNGSLNLVKVDVGLRGLLRRVGLQPIISWALRWLFGYTLSDNLITWWLVQPVGSVDLLKLKFSQARLSHLHPADLADIIEDLDRPERARVFRALDIEVAAEVLEETDPEIQVDLIQELPAEHASDVLEQMSPSAATDLLQDLEEPQVKTLLREMEPEAAEDVRCLLTHDEETAGGMMTTSFFSQPPCATVEEVLAALRREAADLDVIYYVYVEDEHGHLLGAVNLRELLTSDPKARLKDIMITRVVSTTLEADEEDVADLFAKYGLRALPVVDDQGRIHGVIRFKALLEAVAPHLGR